MRSIIANLTPTMEASGPHDFAVRKIARSSVAPPASIASLPYVRDDRETPLCVGRDGSRSTADLPQTAMEIFLRRGLDDPNQIEIKENFSPSFRDDESIEPGISRFSVGCLHHLGCPPFQSSFQVPV